MLNHQLLVASRDSNLQALKEAIADGAFLETRRPFVMRTKPPPPSAPPQKVCSAHGGNKNKDGSREGMTPLMYAAQNGNLATTTLLLEAKALVNASDEDGLRPLHFAATSGEISVCELLLHHGAVLKAADEDGQLAYDLIPEECLKACAERKRWEALMGPQNETQATEAVQAIATVALTDLLTAEDAALTFTTSDPVNFNPDKPIDPAILKQNGFVSKQNND